MKQLLFILLLIVSFYVRGQQTINLYPKTIPNSISYPMEEIITRDKGEISWIKNVSNPTLTLYLPEKNRATGTAVIICPGGGYSGESYKLEGTIIAKAFNSRGIAAFILKYRLPSDSIMIDKTIGPLQDAQQAIKTVRENAKKWNLDPEKIGIMGFSAGGHLASTAGTHYQKAYIKNDLNISLRPSFMILVYPVISMTEELTHKGSRKKLLGKRPKRKEILLFSNELHINSNTPPTWITHTGDDDVVVVDNSIRFYQELIRNKVSAEMHLFPAGNHGFVLKQSTDQWMESIFQWMQKEEIVSKLKQKEDKKL